jgi:hypothetical protein
MRIQAHVTYDIIENQESKVKSQKTFLRLR